MPQDNTSRRDRGHQGQSGEVRAGLRAGTGLIIGSVGELVRRGGVRMSGPAYQSGHHAADGQLGMSSSRLATLGGTTAGFRRQPLTITAGGDTQVYLTRVFDALHDLGDVAPEAMLAFLFVVKEGFTPAPRDTLALQFWSRANSWEPRRLAQFHPDRASVGSARDGLDRIMALQMPEPDKLIDVYSARLVLAGQIFGQILHGQKHISLDGRTRLNIQQFVEYVTDIADGLQSIGNIRRQAYARLIAAALLCIIGDIKAAADEFTKAIALIANKASSHQLDQLAHSLDQAAADQVVRTTLDAKTVNSHQPVAAHA